MVWNVTWLHSRCKGNQSIYAFLNCSKFGSLVMLDLLYIRRRYCEIFTNEVISGLQIKPTSISISSFCCSRHNLLEIEITAEMNNWWSSLRLSSFIQMLAVTRSGNRSLLKSQDTRVVYCYKRNIFVFSFLLFLRTPIGKQQQQLK